MLLMFDLWLGWRLEYQKEATASRTVPKCMKSYKIHISRIYLEDGSILPTHISGAYLFNYRITMNENLLPPAKSQSTSLSPAIFFRRDPEAKYFDMSGLSHFHFQVVG